MFRFRHIVILLALYWSQSSVALSCLPMTDRIYLNCKNGSCTTAFGVIEVSTIDPCGRRPVVRSRSEARVEFIEKTAAQSTLLSVDGIYVVTLSGRDREIIDTDSLREPAMIIADLYKHHPELLAENPEGASSLSPVEMLDNFSRSPWLKLQSTNLSALSELELNYHKKARNQLAVSFGWHLLIWGSSLIILIGTIVTTHAFFKRLYRRDNSAATSLRRPVLLQLALLSVIVLLTMLVSSFMFWPGLLLLPVLVIILLVEAWSAWRTQTIT